MEPKVLGEYIATHRVARGLSVQALAEAANISRPYLTQIENGTRSPSEKVLQDVFAALGVSLAQLMTDLLSDQVDPEQFAQLQKMAHIYDTLQKYLTPEQVQEIADAFGSPDEMEASMRYMTMGEPMPAGPDGWLSLSPEDRKLVQRLVNRLRAQQD